MTPAAREPFVKEDLVELEGLLRVVIVVLLDPPPALFGSPWPGYSGDPQDQADGTVIAGDC